MSGVSSPDLPGTVTFAPGPRGGGIASRRHGPHNKDEHDDSPFGAGIAERGRACPRRGKGWGTMSGDEKEDKKPETERKEDEKFKGMVIVKPRPLPGVKPRREAKPETEKKEDIKRRINEELEFLIEMEDRIPRKEEKWDYRRNSWSRKV
jgi:hypothetical protein